MAEQIRWFPNLPSPAVMALRDDACVYPPDHIYPRAAQELMRPDLFAIWHTYPPTDGEPLVAEGTRLSIFPDPYHRETFFIPGAHVALDVAARANQDLWWLLDVGIGPVSNESAKWETRVLNELQVQNRTAIAAVQALRGWNSGTRSYAMYIPSPVTPWRYSFPPPSNAPSLETEFAVQQLRRNRSGQEGPDYYHKGRTIPELPAYNPRFPTWQEDLGAITGALASVARAPFEYVWSRSRFGRRG